MNRTTVAKYATRLALGLAALALAASPSFAQTTIDLCASDGSVTIAGEAIPIWGYVDTTISGVPCTTGLATLPGPVLTVPEGTLTINLTNALSVPVSIFIPGLAKDVSDPLAPVVGTDLQGRERLSSFDQTIVTGGTLGYTWVATEGTHFYHSGTDIRTQVPMGLSGALVVPGAGYPAVADEEVLVFSEIDPNLNNNPAGFGGARVSTWDPQYFLINGQAYDAGSPPAPITVNINEEVLLRFVNAGLDTVVPTFDGGLYMDLIAEDGNLYPAVFSQYGIELQAAKTMDVIVNVDSVGTYALYDRSLHLTNRSALGGGMLAYFSADVAPPNRAPVAGPDNYDAIELVLLSVPAPGVLVNDSDPDGDPLTLNTTPLVGPTNGSLTLFADGSFDYTPSVAAPAVDSFTYEICDPEPLCSPGVVTINIIAANVPPIALDDPDYTTDQDIVLVVAALDGVLANDSDPDSGPSALTAVQQTSPTDGLLTFNSDGSFDYTPNTGFAGVDTFTYTAFDGADDSAPATVTITVIGPSAELGVIISDWPDPMPQGGRLTYSIAVANNGGLDATGVVLTDTLDVNVSFVSASLPACSETGGVVTCTLNTLTTGTSTTVVVEVDVTPAFIGTISNTAVVTLNEGDPIPANNTDIETTTVVALGTYIFSDGFEPGSTIRWSSVVGD